MDYLSNNLPKKADLNKIIEVSYSRLRPIFTTTTTTIAALIPLLISAESSFWKSLSLSITGGIFLSALLVSLFVPIIYSQTLKRKHSINAIDIVIIPLYGTNTIIWFRFLIR